jgi:hypothetical protein
MPRLTSVRTSIRRWTRIDKLINVCWDLDEKNQTRECSGLCEAMDRFHVADAEIITAGYDDRVEFEGKEIAIRNFFSWVRESD